MIMGQRRARLAVLHERNRAYGSMSKDILDPRSLASLGCTHANSKSTKLGPKNGSFGRREGPGEVRRAFRGAHVADDLAVAVHHLAVIQQRLGLGEADLPAALHGATRAPLRKARR